jgi:hypothetical protein
MDGQPTVSMIEPLKRRNRDYFLLETIRQIGPSSSSLLARLTGLNPEAVRNTIRDQGPETDTEYRYVVRLRATEAFANIMAKEGVTVALTPGRVSFTSKKLFDMKAFKDRGLIWSYSIIGVRADEHVIEEG